VWENAKQLEWSEAASRFGVTERHRFAGLPVVELPGDLLVVRAVTPEAKRHALRKLDTLDPRHALQLPTAVFEHTFGMRFDLDLIWLDEHEEVAHVDRDVPPRRRRSCPEAESVVQTVAGQAGAFLAAGLGCRPNAGGPRVPVNEPTPPPVVGWTPGLPLGSVSTRPRR
jgi:uncharacterized membrane protein (UPF0127 family)